MNHYTPYRTLRGSLSAQTKIINITQAQALASMLLFAAVTGLAAQIRLPLPWTPVPITLQTMAVLLSGLVLGRKGGTGAQLLYVGMGTLGVPWFSHWTGGISHLLGPTGGYLAGFVVAAYAVGYLRDTWTESRQPLFKATISLLAINLALIHGMGLVQLGVWLHLTRAVLPGFGELMYMGVLPFIPGDLVKLVIALLLARGLGAAR